MRCLYTRIRMENFKRLTIPSAGEDVEKQELSDTAGGNIEWHNQLCKAI